jgi:hypothetical protein
LLIALLLAGDADKVLPAGFTQFVRGNMLSAKKKEKLSARALLQSQIVLPARLLAVRAKLGVCGLPAPLTFGDLLSLAHDPSYKSVSTFGVYLWARTLPVSKRLFVYQPIPRALVSGLDATVTQVLGKHADSSYLSLGELFSLIKQGGAIVECVDGRKMSLSDVVRQPDAFLPSLILDDHFAQHRDATDNVSLQRLQRLTLLSPELIAVQLQHRVDKAASRVSGNAKRRRTNAAKVAAAANT